MFCRSSCVTLALTALAACANVEANFPNKSAVNYRLDEARFAMDKTKFDDAISVITPILTKYPKNPDVAYVSSMAYAGRAGLRILDLFTVVAKGALSTALFPLIATAYPAAADTNIADIETAMTILETYGAKAADRTEDMNFYALFMYYSRIGITLNRYAYLPDDTLDPAFVACSRSKFPNSAVDTVMTSLPRIVDTVSAIAASGSGFDELKSISNSIPAGIGFDPIPCSSNADNPFCLAIRNLVALGKSTGGIGLGTGEAPCIFTLP